MGYQLDYTFDIYYLIKLLPIPLNFVHTLYRLIDYQTIHATLLGEIIERKIIVNEDELLYLVNERKAVLHSIKNVHNFTGLCIDIVFGEDCDLSVRDRDMDRIWCLIGETIKKINTCIDTIKVLRIDDHIMYKNGNEDYEKFKKHNITKIIENKNEELDIYKTYGCYES